MTMKQVQFLPLESCDDGKLCLPMRITNGCKLRRRNIPIYRQVAVRHTSDSTDVTESDVINALNFYWLPFRHPWKTLAVRQQNAILNEIINNPENEKYFKHLTTPTTQPQVKSK